MLLLYGMGREDRRYEPFSLNNQKQSIYTGWRDGQLVAAPLDRAHDVAGGAMPVQAEISGAALTAVFGRHFTMRRGRLHGQIVHYMF